MENLNHRHERFVDRYCEHLNGARAAREAGYAESRARITASELLSDPDISQMVEDRLGDSAPKSVKEPAERDEVVYAIGAFKVGRVKIGKTAGTPETRKCSMQTGSPVKLAVLNVWHGGSELELFLHEALQGSHVHGEWFEPRKETLALLAAQ